MMFIISRKDRVAEGILECKCGSSKIISTQVQSKSRDEAMSIFARCSIVKRDGKNQLFTILVNKFKMSTIIKVLLEKCERRKKINNNWVEGTPNPGLLEDFLSVNQFQLYHVIYGSV